MNVLNKFSSRTRLIVPRECLDSINCEKNMTQSPMKLKRKWFSRTPQKPKINICYLNETWRNPPIKLSKPVLKPEI